MMKAQPPNFQQKSVKTGAGKWPSGEVAACPAATMNSIQMKKLENKASYLALPSLNFLIGAPLERGHTNQGRAQWLPTLSATGVETS
mmetsp:Transcript_21366/g.47299  ORF Transcript_21366/g.47299 Transcript_21366/m.47299 type:complete len:87 (+) Transcript_21366:39-299(+)